MHKQRGTKRRVMMLWIGLLFVLTGCFNAEVTLSQAKQELNFPVLVPNPALVEWEMEEAEYEDGLLVIRYVNEENSRIDLVQDQNIQGLNIDRLRDHVISNLAFSRRFDENKDVVKVAEYVGEMTHYDESPTTTIFTFIHQNNLFTEVNNKIHYYQVIGRETTKEQLFEFVEVLEASS